MTIYVLIRQKPGRALQLYYVDPLTGKEVTRSAKTLLRREAERAAARWEQDLLTSSSAGDWTWERFRRRFEDEHVPSVSPKTGAAYKTAFNQFERLIGQPQSLCLVDAGVLSRFATALRSEEFPATTVATYMRHVVSALSWASKIGILQQAPKCVMPKTGKRKLMRARPITTEEYERILDQVDKLNLQQPDEWKRFIRGLWLSGLRLGEILQLSWDSPPMRVDLTGRRPRIVAWSEGHKSRSDELLPITPDFDELLRKTTEEGRKGRVFRLQMNRRDISDTITELGKAANVVVNDQGKNATAHDFRRAFGSRWALKVHPVVLQRLMRHKSIETTMKYYVDLDMDKIADQVWEPLEVSRDMSRKRAGRKTEPSKSPGKSRAKTA